MDPFIQSAITFDPSIRKWRLTTTFVAETEDFRTVYSRDTYGHQSWTLFCLIKTACINMIRLILEYRGTKHGAV